MVSVAVIGLALGVIVLMVGNLALNAIRVYNQQKKEQVADAQQAVTQALLLVDLRDGMVARTYKPAPRPVLNLPPTWYKRLRTCGSLTALLLILITFCVQRGLADGTIQSLSKNLNLFGTTQFGATDIQAAAHSSELNAAKQLVRISQLDPNQYNTSSEFNTWAYSACSAAAMTEVFDAYGRNFRITDVLKVESQIGAITPDMGLLDPSGIQLTATQFGFKTTWSNSWTLDQLISTANTGRPVIISFPPDRYAGGHILVVIGGDSNYVYLADTSLWNHRALTHGQFMGWWEGFAAVVTPGN